MNKKGMITALISSICLLVGNSNRTDAAGAYPGYTFYASGQTAYLVDMSGNTLHTWKGGGSAVCVAYLLEDGSVLFPLNNNCSVRRDGAHPSGRFQKINWDGAVTWDFTLCNATYTPGYDIEPMPNGNILIPADNSQSAGVIYEITPTGISSGNIVWQYVLPDSLNSQGTYINSLKYNPDLDMIVVDLQEPVRKLVVIDHSQTTGKVVYTCSVGTSGRVHGAIWSSKYFIGTKTLMPDADTTAMKINNLLVVHNSSEFVEVDMKTNTKTSKTYSFSQNEGSVQRLPNGNTLVQKGMDQTAITELDADGKTVASITAKGKCSRAYRYGLTYAGFSKLSPSAIKQPLISTNKLGPFSYNAVQGICSISMDKSNSMPYTYQIISLSGKTLLSSSSSRPTVEFSTSNFKSGVYQILIKRGTESFRQNFIKVQ